MERPRGGRPLLQRNTGRTASPDRPVGWIAKIDDTPEIRDPEEFKMLAAALETESKTVHFKTWLKDKLDAIAGEEV